MSAWGEARRMAAERHAELVTTDAGLVAAATLLAAAERATQVKRVACPRGDPLLDGAEAAYDHERKRIYHARDLDPPTTNYYVAHEFGHHWLDAAAVCCQPEDMDCACPAEPAASAVGDEDAYSPKERAEALANVFAREFLVPREKLRQLCAAGPVTAEALASDLGVPVDLVMQQMADTLLLPAESEQPRRDREPDPDDSQREAIEAPPGARQVRAGPGTGKTRTLVGRIAHLLRQGEPPATILALTYSNLSAQDLTSRIRAEVGGPATAVWAGTFHAYGLELLRKEGRHLGFEGSPKLLDRTDSLMLLEELLPALQLDHYLDLREPVLKLRFILNAICRAKDELVTPDRYRELAHDMWAAAGADEKLQEAAAKATEVAGVYARYEQELRSRGAVDFGDLVALPVRLLTEHSEVRDRVRGRHRHILVDEYQDMNRASSVLLKLIVTPGLGPWVVGDVRQAVYRFRGASPLNMSRFEQDFPGAKPTDLSINYRSGGRIVDAFQTFGKQMAAAKAAGAIELTAHRGKTTGAIHYDVATTREAEWEGIAAAILARRASGIPFGHQTVLARSHTILARLARRLERADVPCLYFGDFFERPEVRDLLAFLSVIAEPRGIGLLRVAQLPQYGVSAEDVCTLANWRRAQQPVPTMLDALRRLDEVPELSDRGRAGLRRLEQDVAFVTFPMTPHQALLGFLFRRPGYLEGLLADRTVAGQQRRLAVYQLLQFAFAFKRPGTGNPKRAFLDHVRRLEVLDEEKQLRQLPAAARDIDAVRLMTVHAAKGLEFPVVHVATLTPRHFPAQGRSEPCPAPAGMIADDDLMTREAEEDSLFFVAMSRAKDVLHLSRPLMAGKQSTKNPSRFLKPIAAHLPKKLEAAASWVSDGPTEPPHPRLAGRRPAGAVWSMHEIESYLECPRRYYYESELGLKGNEEESPYLRFHAAIRATAAWLGATTSPEERRGKFSDQFDADWATHGPAGHPFDLYYQEIAKKMLTQAAAVLTGESLPAERTVTLPASGAVVRCRADHIQSTPDGIVIHRLKASRLAKTKETPKARYVLLEEAIRAAHEGARVVFEHVSLLTGQRRDATLGPDELRTELAVIDEAVKDIGDGKFDPNPGDRCPTCPYYVVCPAHGALL